MADAGSVSGRDSSCLARREAPCRLTEAGHPDTNEVENRMSGGVDGTRTRGLCRDRAAF